MDYQPKHFNPGGKADTRSNVTFRPKDGKAEDMYVFAPKAVLAINVALATTRPLLISGEPGCGKSSLARAVASALGWRYYQRTVTSRTQAADLFWSFDALQRLSDANRAREDLPAQLYIEPGPLWWAFDPRSAAQRGHKPLPDEEAKADDVGVGAESPEAAVVLVDEIDKADPDVPNDLLEPLDRKTFTVRETGDEIAATRRVLLLLTTNRERSMPRAFLRRCVTLELEEPNQTWLENIATQRYGDENITRYREIAKELMVLRQHARRAGVREPSTAEYLDAVVAVQHLEPSFTSQAWRDIQRALLWKSDVEFPLKPAKVEAS